MSVVGVQEALRAAYEEHYVPLLRLCVLLSLTTPSGHGPLIVQAASCSCPRTTSGLLE